MDHINTLFHLLITLVVLHIYKNVDLLNFGEVVIICISISFLLLHLFPVKSHVVSISYSIMMMTLLSIADSISFLFYLAVGASCLCYWFCS